MAHYLFLSMHELRQLLPPMAEDATGITRMGESDDGVDHLGIRIFLELG